MSQAAVILGANSTGVSICRILSGLSINCFLVAFPGDNWGHESTYARTITFDGSIGNLKRKIAQPSAVVFAAGDAQLLWYEKHKLSLGTEFIFSGDLQHIRWIDKKNSMNDLVNFGFSFPKHLTPDAMRFPAFLKHPIQGVFQIENKAEFNRLRAELSIDKYLLQEGVPGATDRITFLNAYRSKKMDYILLKAGRKLVAEPDTGNTCYAEALDSHPQERLCIDFLKTINYAGYASFEFKESVDRQFFLIEPTFYRVNLHIGLTPQLIILAYADATDTLCLLNKLNVRSPKYWANEVSLLKCRHFLFFVRSLRESTYRVLLYKWDFQYCRSILRAMFQKFFRKKIKKLFCRLA